LVEKLGMIEPTTLQKMGNDRTGLSNKGGNHWPKATHLLGTYYLTREDREERGGGGKGGRNSVRVGEVGIGRPLRGKLVTKRREGRAEERAAALVTTRENRGPGSVKSFISPGILLW